MIQPLWPYRILGGGDVIAVVHQIPTGVDTGVDTLIDWRQRLSSKSPATASDTERCQGRVTPPPLPATPWRSRQRQPRSSVCSDCAQLFPMMSVDWGMCSLVVAPRAGFGRVRFRVEQARRPCATPSSGRSRVHDADPTYRAGFSRRSTPPQALGALRPAPRIATPCPLHL